MTQKRYNLEYTDIGWVTYEDYVKMCDDLSAEQTDKLTQLQEENKGLREAIEGTVVHLRAKSGPRDLPGEDQIVVRRAWLRALAERLEGEDNESD